MVAKWSFFIFLGLTAIFTGQLHAGTSRDNTAKIQKISKNPALSDSMKANLIASLSKNSFEVTIPEWVLTDNEHRANLEHMLKQIGDDSFGPLFSKFASACHLKIETLSVDQLTAVSGKNFYVDVKKADTFLNFLSSKKQACDEAFQFVAQLDGHYPKSPVKLDGTLVVNGEVSLDSVSRWTAALQESQTKAVVNQFIDSCGLSERPILLNSILNQSSEGTIIGINDPVQKTLTKMKEATDQCNTVYPLLGDLNLKHGIPNNLYFFYDPSALLISEIKTEEIVAWVNFLEASSDKVANMRDVILNSPKTSEFKPLRDCLKSKKADKCTHIIPVEFAGFWGMSSQSFWRGLGAGIGLVMDLSMISTTFWMGATPQGSQPLKSLVLQKGFAGVFVKKVYLDTKQAPGIPEVIN